jgi:hypothetical protein
MKSVITCISSLRSWGYDRCQLVRCALLAGSSATLLLSGCYTNPFSEEIHEFTHDFALQWLAAMLL